MATTTRTGMSMKSKSTSGVRKGPSNKNVQSRRRPAGRGTMPTAPLRGPDKGTG